MLADEPAAAPTEKLLPPVEASTQLAEKLVQLGDWMARLGELDDQLVGKNGPVARSFIQLNRKAIRIAVFGVTSTMVDDQFNEGRARHSVRAVRWD